MACEQEGLFHPINGKILAVTAVAEELETGSLETLAYINGKFNIDQTLPSPISIQIGRFKDTPRLFNELGFKIGAEIGVYQGEYSRWLLRMMPGLKLYGIDVWESYRGYKDFKETDILLAYEKAVANTKGYDCELIKGWSHEVAGRFDDGSLDFVFIDGNHAFEYVVRDISVWSKKVRPGGIVYGHDFDDYTGTSRWKEMQVIPAVEGWMKANRINPWFVLSKNRNKCWMYIR